MATKRSAKRDAELGNIARQQVDVGGLGHVLLLPQEKIVEQESLSVILPHVRLGDVEFKLFRSLTSADKGRTGRVVISTDKDLYEVVAGAFFSERRDVRGHCVNAVWVMPSWRKRGLGRLLAEKLRDHGIVCAFEPMSTEGSAWVSRQGFRRQ